MRMREFLMSKWAFLIPLIIGGFCIVYNDKEKFNFSDVLAGIFYCIALAVIIWQEWEKKIKKKVRQ
ncbi:hypothetical protein [Lentilactobacillus farraginis]|uniref:hypothetical protein n=1 Tax=Lentilactobacillus farraginis TaxID=390841 RepID=UPI00054D2F98|nr:hypothetical protein [Lentilactobacillus farraginis]